MLPVVTIIGLQIGILLGGAVLTETIFNLAGVGKTVYDAITARDYVVIQGFTLIIAIGFVLVNLIVDISYAWLDPRIRPELSDRHDRCARTAHARTVEGARGPPGRARGAERSGTSSAQRSAQVGAASCSFSCCSPCSRTSSRPIDPTRSCSAWRRERRCGRRPCIHLLGCPETEPQHLMGTDGNAATCSAASCTARGSRCSSASSPSGSRSWSARRSVPSRASSAAHSDNVLMRGMDVLLVFPALLLAIADRHRARARASSTPSWRSASSPIPVFARDHARERALGPGAGLRDGVAGTRREPRRHPPPSHPARMRSRRSSWPGTLGSATAILEVAALSFLGLGAQPPLAEWGSMIGAERNQLFSAPHLILFPGIALAITVLGLQSRRRRPA